MPDTPDTGDAEGRVDSFLGQDTPAAQSLQEGLINAPASHPAVDLLKKVGWLATELVPGVAAARHAQAVREANTKAHLQNAMNMHLISTALGMAKEGDAGALQDKDVQKAVKMTMGPAGEGFMHIAGTLAQRAHVHKQGFIALYQNNVAKGMAPQDAMAAAIQVGTQAGLDIPPGAQTQFTAFGMKPETAVATQTATAPGKIDTAGKIAQRKQDVQYDPANVGRRGAAEAFIAGEKAKTQYAPLGPREQAQIRAEQRKDAERVNLLRKHEEADMRKEGRKVLSSTFLANVIAFDKDGKEIDLKSGEPPTPNTLDAITKAGGSYHTKGFLDTAESFFGTASNKPTGKVAPPSTRGTHYDPDQNAADKAMFPGIFSGQ